MDNYLGEFPVNLTDTPFAKFGIADWALYFIAHYGGIDGAHHKQWLIDQIARILNGADIHIVQARWGGGHAEYRISVGTSETYAAWVKEVKAGEDGPETYAWKRGTPP